ncbi:MAG: nuclear transport factor 2 family protein [Inhella sp.]
MSHPIETIQAVYAAFGRGDIAFILAQLAPDIAWEHWPNHSAHAAGVPWMKERQGPAGAQQFFEQIAGFTFHRFDVQQILAGGNEVIGRVAIDVTLPNGRRVQDDEIHWFRFNQAGQIDAFRHYLDSAKHIEAAR